MAVTKIWRVRGNAGDVIDYANDPEKTIGRLTEDELADLADVLEYADDEVKTENHCYTTAINCQRDTAGEEFNEVKKRYGKRGGIVAIHGYQSFEEEDLSPETAHDIGVKLANELWADRFQVLVATHLNTEHVHNHFVINSVSFEDGKRFHMCTDRYREMRAASDRLCREYELSVIENPKGRGMSQHLYKMEQAGMPTRYSVARAALDDAISRSLTIEELKHEMKQMGYQIQMSERRKYWTVTLPGWSKPIRMNKLGDDYTKERLIQRLEENEPQVRSESLQRQYNRRRSRYDLPTRKDKIGKLSGFQRRYLRCLYELGYLPRYVQNPARVHRIFKDELMKCEMYSREARLLCDNDIVTDRDLFVFEKSLEGKMYSLNAERDELRKEVKRVIPEERRQAAKERIAQVTSELRSLRSQKKLCADIKERSEVIEEKLAVIDKERERGREVNRQ